MNKKELYARQYNLAKNKLSEDWTDTLSAAWETAKKAIPTSPAELLIPGYKAAKTYIAPKISKETKEKIDDVIDTVQTGVDVASIPVSFVPGLNLVGSAIDAASAAVDVEQGQYGDAAIRGGIAAVGLLPGLGGAGKIAKGTAAATKAVKATEAGVGAAKAVGGEVRAAETAVKLAQAGRASSGAAEAGEFAAKASRPTTQTATKTTTELAPYAPKISQPPVVKATNVRSVGARKPQGPAIGRARPAAKTVGKSIQIAKPVVRTAGKTSSALRALGKTGLAVGTGTVIGTVGKTLYDTLRDRTSDSTKTPKEKPISRIEADVTRSELGMFNPGEVAGYSKSVHKGREQQDSSERFRNPWLLTPKFSAIGRSMTVDSRGRIVEANDLSLKVKSAVSNYLKSKHGKELKNHLDNISKQLEK